MKKQKPGTISFEKTLSLLKSKCSPEVVKHSLAVSKVALKIGKNLKDRGYDINLKFIKVASLLHDIGRAKTHGIRHGVEGGKFLKKLGFPEKFIRVCERHLGGGIGKEEAKKLGLPPKDYLPQTLEEKIISHADNLIAGDKVVPIQETIQNLKQELGKNHPAIPRVKSLSEEIESLISKSKK